MARLADLCLPTQHSPKIEYELSSMSVIAAEKPLGKKPLNVTPFTTGILDDAMPGKSDSAEAIQAEAAPLELTFITTREAFNALEADWNELYSLAGKPGNPFQSFGWCWHWANNFMTGGDRNSFAIVTGRRNGKLTTIWPLVCQKSSGLTHLNWIGRPVTQYGDVLVDSTNPLQDLRAGWNFLKAQAKADTVELYKVRADAAIAPLLPEIGAIATHHDVARYADLTKHPTFTEYAQQRYSKKRRNVLRRYRRRFEEMGDVKLQILNEGAETTERVRELLAMKMQWLKAKSLVSTALQDPRTHTFFIDAVSDTSHPTGCRVTLLTCDDKLIAGDINFAVKNRSAAHVITYDLAYEKWSPGHLMTMSNLECSMQDGNEIFDFMGPDATFKQEWSDDAIEVDDWAVPLTLKGSLWCKVYLGFARDRLKQGYQHLPTSVKKAIAGTFATLLLVVDKV